MKKLTFLPSQSFVATALFAAAMAFTHVSQAGLQVPYAPDADTLHLWHFDDPTNNQGTANFVAVTDAVATASITLTNYGLGAASINTGNAEPGVPPYTNIFLLTQSATANLNGCLNIRVGGGTGGNSGKAYAWCGTTNNIGGYFPDTTSFRNATSGAFTFEALLYIQGPVFSASIGTEWEIFCGDSQGESGGRSWQFRLQPGTTPSLNVNFITASGGGSPNVSPLLPTSGPNALSVSNWYHVALTYTGNTPTNGDDVGVLRFYWTYFDGFRTNADLLASFTNATWGTLGGGPIPAIGGSARRNNGVGNAGAFEGLIDEVRISDIARGPGQMAFVSGGPQNPPSFVSQPAASTAVGFGKSLSVSTLLTGSLPHYPQWQATNTVTGGWTNVTGQTDSSLQINPVSFANAGLYRLVVTNAFGGATSSVASVTVGAAFSELFNTGVDSNGVADVSFAGTVDAHYVLAQSADVNHLGPATLIWNQGAYPVLPGGVFSLIGGASQWIGPDWNNGGATYTSPQGQYIYRTTFLIDSVDLSQPTTLSGTWWENTTGSDILLNGKSTGKLSLLTNSPGTAAVFTITNGFVPGINTIDFIIPCVAPNGSYPESAARIELSALGQAALPAGIPVITNQPASRTVRDGGKTSFAVVALGRPPLTYQWWANSAVLTGATNRTLAFDPVSTGSQGTNFFVVISNNSGSVTSQVASLTLTTNRPPVPVNFNLVTYSNTPVDLSVSTIVSSATDPDGDAISFSGFDGASTNAGSVAQNGINLTYTPPTDYLVVDQYGYVLSDSIDSAQGFVNINVIPFSPPILASSPSGSGFVLKGSGGTTSGTYHILSTTNLTVALTNWTSVAGTFDLSGKFNITNAITPGVPQKFFILQIP